MCRKDERERGRDTNDNNEHLERERERTIARQLSVRVCDRGRMRRKTWNSAELFPYQENRNDRFDDFGIERHIVVCLRFDISLPVDCSRQI